MSASLSYPYRVDVNSHVVGGVGVSGFPLSPMPGAASEFSEGQTTTPRQLRDVLDSAGVTRAVLFNSRFHGWDHAYMIEAVERFPFKFYAVANLDVFADDARGRFEELVSSFWCRGIRLWGGGRTVARWIDDPRHSWIWERCEELGLPVNAQKTDASCLRSTCEVLTQFPGLRLTLNNLAQTDSLSGEDRNEAEARLFDLGRFPSVRISVSTHFCARVLDGSRDDIRTWHRILNHFGAHRAMWSAFYPSRQDTPYPQAVEAVDRLASQLAQEDAAAFLGGTARSLYETPMLDSDKGFAHA